MRPRAFVFVGPTLAGTEPPKTDGMTFLPPAAQGDVYRAARRRPAAIGIVDGYFEGRASIWHKEILWAMDQGVHVFGAASMGALRAAELHSFGMKGIGAIFQAFRDGILQDDDEVAALHAPADAGYLPLCEPMVNIRATLRRAERQGVIDARDREALVRCAKATFYQERCWPDLLVKARCEGMAGTTIEALGAWLSRGKVDQKANDALTMIGAMADLLAASPGPLEVAYHFEWTGMWDRVVSAGNADPPPPAVAGAKLLEELRLEPGHGDTARRLALLRLLASEKRLDRQPSGHAGMATALRSRLGLYSQADFDRWLAQNHLDRSGFERMMANEAALGALMDDHAGTLDPYLLDQLRIDGRYRRLAERALAKEACLAATGDEDPDVPLNPWQLRIWYFEHRLGQTMPDDLDDHVRKLGFADRDSFDRALRREYLYVLGLAG